MTPPPDAAVSRDPVDPDCVAALALPDAYPRDPTASAGVEEVQTHLSWVFLTPSRVYKFRKDVDLGFVDFTSRAARLDDCLREVRLNRRLAPDVYLGLARAHWESGALRVGPVEESVDLDDNDEPCVVMRRLPPDRDALSLLSSGELKGRHVDAVAASVAEFHAAHRLAGPSLEDEAAWLRRIVDPVAENFSALAAFAGSVVSRAALERAEERAMRFGEERRGELLERIRAGLAVDGHGDLHLEHVWFETDRAPPLIIDCLEFREDFRQFDAACDVAFLAMDLRYRHRERWAARFLGTYAAAIDDFGLYSVVDYYMSYRAAVRAKVAAMVAADERVDRPQRTRAAASARRHLSLTSRLLAPRRPGGLVLLCGTVGSGKSTMAALVADELRGVVVSSDRVRKRLAGIDPLVRAETAPDTGIYTSRWTARTYAALLERAQPVAASGRVAVLDATFASAPRRARARAWARERKLPVLLVEVRCAESVALERLKRRAAAGSDASDAGPELLALSADRFEAPSEWPAASRLVVDTGARGWRGRARAALRALLPTGV